MIIYILTKYTYRIYIIYSNYNTIILVNRFTIHNVKFAFQLMMS